MSLYHDLLTYVPPQGIDPLKPFRANLGQAENLFAKGEECHGEAAILAVFTFASLIRKGFKIGSLTMDVETACAMARKLYNRLPTHDGTTKLLEMQDKLLGNWMKEIPIFFYPFSCNGRVLAASQTRKKALKEFNGMVPPEGMSKADYETHVLNCLDQTSAARVRCKGSFATACLLVARDPDNVRLPQFDRELGLLVLHADLMPIVKLEADNSIVEYKPFHGPEKTIRIPAVAKRQQMANGVPCHPTDNSLKSKDFRSTLKQLCRAAVIPPDHEANISKLITAHDDLAAFLTPTRSKLSADEDAYLTKIRSLILAHDKRLAEAEALTLASREKAAVEVLKSKKVKDAAAREPKPGYGHKDKDGNAINEEALKTA